jgi:hypothetical protein
MRNKEMNRKCDIKGMMKKGNGKEKIKMRNVQGKNVLYSR